MGIKERLFEHPVAALTGCFAWLPLAIMIYFLLAWMVQGDVDLLPGIVGIMLCLTLGYFALVPPRDEIALVICGVSWGTVLGFPLLQLWVNKHQMKQIDIEAIERIYESLGQRPLNPALRFRLAKLLYARGLIQEAVSVAAPMLASMPTQFFAEEHRDFQTWVRHLKGAQKESFTCLNCHSDNKPGEVFCQSCGRPLFLSAAQGQWVGTRFLRQMLIIWTAAISLLVGIPIIAMMIVAPLSAILILLLTVSMTVMVARSLMPKSTEGFRA